MDSFEQWRGTLPATKLIQTGNCCRMSYEAGQESRQAEIDDLKAQLAKAQAGPEGFILVSAEQMSQWGHMANCAEQYGCPECYEARGYTHSLACEINAYFNVSEAQEQNA